MDIQSIELMSDADIRAALGMSDGVAGRGFDAATQARVFADELIRSRGRFAQYRTLYSAYLGAGKPFMIENLDEIGDGDAVPAKLIFADAPPALELEESPTLMIWTERTLLEALSEERSIQDFFANLLDELDPELIDKVD